MHPEHRTLLRQVQAKAGKIKKQPFLDNYLGNTHPKYKINGPTLRGIAKDWVWQHRDLTSKVFSLVVDSLVHGKTSTEKCLAGLLLDCSRPAHRMFKPQLFDRWLNQLVGWVEIDTLCTGRYARTEVPRQWMQWKKLLYRFSRSKNISKRRASLVLLCSPLRKQSDPQLLAACLENVDRLKAEREILITKAVSWVLRSAAVHHAAGVKKYVDLNKGSLPAIAVRETLTKLFTGVKNKRK